MPRATRLLAVVVAGSIAAVAGGCATHDRTPDRAERAPALALAAQHGAGFTLYWLGRSFEGLALTAVLRGPGRTSFVYGTCDPRGSDTGCAPPLTVQVSSICADNALVLDIRPSAKRRARGATVLDYGEAGRLELDAGASHVTVSAELALSVRATAALRPVAGPAHRARPLPAPRYPRYYADHLRRVVLAYIRLGSVRAVRDELGISQSAVRFELGLARDLGAARLGHGRHDSPALDEVKRDLLSATLADSGGAPRGARLSAAGSARRGRALRAGCPLEPR